MRQTRIALARCPTIIMHAMLPAFNARDAWWRMLPPEQVETIRT
ncbi:hypothetical protein OKC48_23840 [Methylorubrum extorquens]|nr:hypothetical protein [Methylorubrum extorquens]UYW26264.1 hypothetical protein OKC48_23840 [Methylorubrum extorquens]